MGSLRFAFAPVLIAASVAPSASPRIALAPLPGTVPLPFFALALLGEIGIAVFGSAESLIVVSLRRGRVVSAIVGTTGSLSPLSIISPLSPGIAGSSGSIASPGAGPHWRLGDRCLGKREGDQPDQQTRQSEQNSPLNETENLRERVARHSKSPNGQLRVGVVGTRFSRERRGESFCRERRGRRPIRRWRRRVFRSSPRELR